MKRIVFFGFAIALILLFSVSCDKSDEIKVVNADYVSLYELNKEIIEINNTNVATGFGSVYSTMVIDSAGRAEIIQDFIVPVRFLNDKSGYFFVENFNAWMLAHAEKPGLIGTNRMEVQDETGKFYVKEMVNTVKYIGYGFVEYYFENPNSGLVERKLAFVKAIPETEIFIGSGTYGFAIENYFTRMEANEIIVYETTLSFAEGIGGVFENYISDSLERVEFCRQLIDHVRFFENQSGYFFIYDFDCRNVAHGTQKDLQGEDLYNYQDSKGNYVIRDLVAIARDQGEGTYEYYWNNPVNGEEEPKLAWVTKIPGINYFIGSGIYLSEY